MQKIIFLGQFQFYLSLVSFYRDSNAINSSNVRDFLYKIQRGILQMWGTFFIKFKEVFVKCEGLSSQNSKRNSSNMWDFLHKLQRGILQIWGTFFIKFKEEFFKCERLSLTKFKRRLKRFIYKQNQCSMWGILMSFS